MVFDAIKKNFSDFKKILYIVLTHLSKTWASTINNQFSHIYSNHLHGWRTPNYITVTIFLSFSTSGKRRFENHVIFISATWSWIMKYIFHNFYEIMTFYIFYFLLKFNHKTLKIKTIRSIRTNSCFSIQRQLKQNER